MTYEQYIQLANKRFPQLNITKMPDSDVMENVRRVSEALFISGECSTPLAIETREQLRYQRVTGTVKFLVSNQT